MTTSLQRYFDAVRDAIFAAITPDQQAMLDRGDEVSVKVGAMRFGVRRAGPSPDAEIWALTFK